MAKKKIRKKHPSKYRKKYGYSILDIERILGWSTGTIHAYFQDTKKRKEMLVEVEKKCKKR
jgi:hypothetical protein